MCSPDSVLGHGPDVLLLVEVEEVLEVVVGLRPALVPGWADMGSACESLLCSTWVVIIARAVVKVPSIFFTSIRVALSSRLESSCCWNSGGG